MPLSPLTRYQIPDHSIFDINGKQTYLGNTYGVSIRPTFGAEDVEVPVLIIQNPPTNTTAIFSFTRRVSCTTFGAEINYNVYLNPNLITPGTPVLPVNLRLNSLNVSAMTASLNPTVTGASEIQTVTTVADSSGSLNNTYFFLNSSAHDYFVWFNVGGAGTNPAPGIPIEVSIPTNATSSQVASAISNALNTLPAQFTATAVSNVVTVTNTGSGAVNPMTDGSNPTTFTFAVVAQGTDEFGIYITTLGASISPVVDNILYVIDPGQNVLVTGLSNSAGVIGAVEIDWFEI